MFFTQPSLLFILGLAFSFPKKSQPFREKIDSILSQELVPAQLNPHNKNSVIWNALSQSSSFPFRWTRVTRALGTRLRELKIFTFDDNLKAVTRDKEKRDIGECLERVVSHWNSFFDEKWRLTESGRKLGPILYRTWCSEKSKTAPWLDL